MNSKPDNSMHAGTIGVLCICTLAIILVAGLWPFHAPLNDVGWLHGGNGIRFGQHGSVMSSTAFRPQSSESLGACALEVWLEPTLQKGRHTILAFEGLGGDGAPFLLQQNGDSLIVQRHNVDENSTYRTAEFSVDGALPAKKRVFVTVTMGSQETSVYLDGGLIKTAQIQGKPTSSFTGRLVLGNSPSASDSWSGQIVGLALYDRRLDAAQVSKHFADWTKNSRPAFTDKMEPIAAYLFGERGGRVVHNQVTAGTDLAIPARYFVLHPEFLSLPWHHYHATWSYWADLTVNIAGFVPFGFFLVAYLSAARPTQRVGAITIGAGFLTSLTIEILQAFLPTRDSGMNDLITNTLGTAVGVLIYRSFWVQTLVKQMSVSKLALRPKTGSSLEAGSPV
jgi:VanZ family protein